MPSAIILDLITFFLIKIMFFLKAVEVNKKSLEAVEVNGAFANFF